MDTTGRERRGRATRAAQRAVAALVVGLALVATPPAAGQSGGSGGVDVDALRAEYEDLVGEEAQTLVDYDLASARLAELLVEVQRSGEAVEAAEVALADAEVDLASRRDDEAAAARALGAAEAEEAEAEEQLRAHAVESYMGAGASPRLATLVDILEGDDTAVARGGYQESVTIQQQRLVDVLVDARQARAAAADLATEAREGSQAQRDRVDELRAASVAALEESTRLSREAAEERARQALLLGQVRSRLVTIEARIVSLDRAADGIAQLLAAYQAGDPMPVPGEVVISSPAPGTPIGSDYGPRHHPILAITRLHAGIDYGLPMGTPVRAAADGVVLLAEERGGYGLTVVIAHESSLGTVYAHNSAFDVAVGDVVEEGDVIARVGSTGLSTGPHIHFETRIQGVPVDPKSFLPPEEGGTARPPG